MTQAETAGAGTGTGTAAGKQCPDSRWPPVRSEVRGHPGGAQRTDLLFGESDVGPQALRVDHGLRVSGVQRVQVKCGPESDARE